MGSRGLGLTQVPRSSTIAPRCSNNKLYVFFGQGLQTHDPVCCRQSRIEHVIVEVSSAWISRYASTKAAASSWS